MVDILEVDVVICGAGLGGLAAAQGLINSGFSVMSFEKNSGFQPRGAALGISPNGLKALELLVPGLGKMIFDKGTRVSTASTEEVFPNQGRMFAWAHVRSLLLPSNLDLRMGSEFVDFEEKGDFIYSRFNCKKNGKEDEILNVRSRVLCGADGIHSAVSKHLNGRKAIPTGAVNWRCSIEASPDDIEGEVKVEMKGDRCFGIFNVANQKLCWAAVTQRDPNTVMESITRKSREEIKKEALEEFSDFSQKYLDLIARTNADHIYYGPLLVHDLPKAIDQGWGGTGRVALLGDSAHGIRPASGIKFNIDKIVDVSFCSFIYLFI